MSAHAHPVTHHAEAPRDGALTEERRSDRHGAIGIGREEAVDLGGAIAVADHRRRPPEPRELRQPVVTARPARDAGRRQVAQLGACPRDGTLLGQRER